ncbi:PAS domain-containing protein [Paraburkholderia azotifigens]|uniref:PAS domain-containing protein n=1 Tax=Paraburkholderia azotifigens TaxID=2057004 RepID=UPI001F02DA0D|nr:PAS domain-containing protein [Paraburkholderia azotifigens]
MSLKWKLIWPAATSALLILIALAASPVPALIAGHVRSGLLMVVAVALAVLLVVIGAVSELRVCRPLRAILHTFENATIPNATGRAADEVQAVQRAAGALRDKAEALGQALNAAEAKRLALAAELQYSEERYVLAMRIADDGPWEWNLQTNEFVLSTRWKCMLGYGDDEFLDSLENWRAHIHPLDLAGVDATLQCQLVGQERQFEQQFRLLHRDGRYRWISSLGTVIRHASGKPLRLVALDTDITRVKHIESVLQHIVEGTAGMGGRHFSGRWCATSPPPWTCRVLSSQNATVGHRKMRGLSRTGFATTSGKTSNSSWRARHAKRYIATATPYSMRRVWENCSLVTRHTRAITASRSSAPGAR